MTLADLDACLLRRVPGGHRTDETSVAAADGVMFLCPVCFRTNGGPVGTHSVICWSPKVPPDVDPKPGRWNLVGSSLADLSLVAGSSSVALRGGCNAHFFVRAGEIVLA